MNSVNTRRPNTTRLHNAALGVSLLLVVQGCSLMGGTQDGPPDQDVDWQSIPNPTPRAEPHSKRGNPKSYVVMGKRYFVKSSAQGFTQRGIASWYGTKFHGRTTSSGEVYDMYKMTAAHKTLPLPTYVKVANLDNQKEIIVRVNDRGPFVDGRIIDLSYVAAKKLGITENGTASVKISAINTTNAAAPPTTLHGQHVNNEGQARYFLQVGAFSQRQLAEQFASKLMALPVEPVIITNTVKQHTALYQVRVGPFKARDQIKSMASRLMDLGFTDTYVVSVNEVTRP